MNQFVRVQLDTPDNLDWVNLHAVARVHAEAVATDSWVVKVLLVTGTEIIDSRHLTEAAAQDRLVAILPGED